MGKSSGLEGEVRGSERVCRATEGSKRRSRIWERVVAGRVGRVVMGGRASIALLFGGALSGFVSVGYESMVSWVWDGGGGTRC